MPDEKTTNGSLKILLPIVVLVLLAAVIGFYYPGVLQPSSDPGPAPENDAIPVSSSHGDTSPDGTNCRNVYNLQEENRDSLAAPTVVDINEANGNLLVRGPLPLIIRDGTGNTAGCRNKADWQFAYDNLNGMLKNVKEVSPAYFSSGKSAALKAQMQGFDLADYHVIVISLLNTDTNADYFVVENVTFGQKYSRCAQPVVEGTLRGQPANLIWSSVGACANDEQCRGVLNDDSDVLCSYNNLMNEISTLMAQKDPSGKKTLIYVHCTHGADRTGIVTMGYLMKDLKLDYDKALLYTDNLGQDHSDHPHNLADTYLTMAKAYCKEIGSCQSVAGASPTPVVTVPVVTTTLPVTTLPVQRPVATQTPVGRYNPQDSNGATF